LRAKKQKYVVSQLNTTIIVESSATKKKPKRAKKEKIEAKI
jgi:hypothetical protein